MNRRTRRQVAATGCFLALAAGATVVLSPRTVVATVAGLGDRPLVFGAALLTLYLLRPLLAWPISPISALVGFVLGMPAGIPVALAGAVLTCVPPFFFARYAGRGGGLFGRLNEAGRDVVAVTGEARGVLAARLSPLPADPVSYGAGFAGVSTRSYVAGTFVGEIPWVIVEVLAGASMREVSMHGLGASLHVLALSFAVAALLVAGPTYRHVRGESPA